MKLICFLLGLLAFAGLFLDSRTALNTSVATETDSPYSPVVSPTPCPSPRPPTNKVDACNPAPPIDRAQMAERRKKWDIEKKKLLEASYPLTNEAWIDVNGDGSRDHVYYRVQRWKDDFEGLLRISSANGAELWSHEFFMRANDLAKFLAEVLHYDNVSDWVKSVFDKNADYSFDSKRRKLKPSELDEDQLRQAAKLHKKSFPKLRLEILAQETNLIFSYRAEWREDLVVLVYVPSLKQFVCFSRGY